MLESPLHEHHLLRYDVEIKDQSFHKSEKTAIIHFFDENNKRVTSLKLAVILKEEIYDWIDKGLNINLTGAYVKDFSLVEYRTKNGLGDHAPITMVDVRARKTFFDCEVLTDFSYAVFAGEKTTFEASVFGNGFTNFFNVNFGNGDVIFRKAKFGSGSTSFQSAKFGDGNIIFAGTNFGTGDLNFVDADFGTGHVDYRNTYFGDGTVDFKFAKFSKGDVSFERATFGTGRKDFKNVEFGGGKIDFKKVFFNNGHVSFEGVEFGNGRVNFRNSRFGEGDKSFEKADFADGEAQFDFVDFGKGAISFNQARVANISFRSCHLDSYMDLRFEECASLDLKSAIVRDILDVKPEDERVAIKEMNLSDMRILGRLFIGWRENNVNDLIYNQKSTTLFQKSEQFRILKENFRNNGQYEDEDAAYLEFKRCESKARLKAAIWKDKKNAIWAFPLFYFQKYVFDYIGRYATAPVRVLGNSVLAVFVFGLLYYFSTHYFPAIGSVVSTLPTGLNHATEFWNCVYYSAITFCTVGYGDYFPEGYLKILAAFEGFSGIFLMSYFTVAFVRKILR